MKVDVRTLGTFYRMAREGAGLAAGRLTRMADVPTRVGVTRMSFVRADELRAQLEDGTRRAGIRVRLTGDVAGDSLILLEEEDASQVATSLLEGVPSDGVDNIARSALVELGQIMTSGFVDGWAAVLDAEVDVEPPEYVVGRRPEQLLSGVDAADGDDLALLFRSRIETVGEAVEFDHYLFPAPGTVERLLDQGRRDDAGIEYDKLAGFNRMAHKGAREVADNLAAMTDLEMAVDVQRITFVSLDTIPEAIPNERLVSVAFRFTGTPSGYLVFVFEEESARGLIEAALGEVPDRGLGAMGEDAISEFGNVMASGFLDGWANVLDTTIDHTTPRFTHDLGASVVDPLIIGLSKHQEFAFVFDTRIEATDRAIDVEIYAIPDERPLEQALNALDVSAVGEVPIEARMDVAAVEDRPETIADIDDVEEGR